MRPYTETEINNYVTSGDPMDKAGAYAIQNRSFHPVRALQRCYANVVGLPLCAVVELLKAYKPALNLNIPQLCLTHFDYRCPAIDKGILR
jgi:predicted house-cleaning NTP pyrophosphatase (Maf/HAM1 superfamily)